MRRRLLRACLLLLTCSALLANPPLAGQSQETQDQEAQDQEAQNLGPETNLPLPRFVALKDNEARMRSQPSVNHSIEFVYKRAGLPLMVLEERGNWRRVRDHEGIEGWMYVKLLVNERTFRVMAPVSKLYLRAQETSPVRAELAQGVIGDIKRCRRDGWCRLTVERVIGWGRAEDLWGVFPEEEF